MKLFVFLAVVCASTALAQDLSVQEQLDEMRQLIQAQALRIEELEARSEVDQQLQEEHHSRRLAVDPALKKKIQDSKGVRMETDNAAVTFGKKSDVAFVRTGPNKAAIVGDIRFTDNVAAGDIMASSAKLKKDLTADGRVTAGSIKIKGGIRVTDDIVLKGPNHHDPGTVGFTYASGVLKPGQSSPANYVNPNSWAGNGKISITICSMHNEGIQKDGKINSNGSVNSHHVYKAYWNAHGQGYNDFGKLLISRLKDGALSIEDNRHIKKFGNPGMTATGFHASGCVFKNKDKKQKAFWIIKQLPITTFTSTRHAAQKTGPWSI